jgi:hypothetical protein
MYATDVKIPALSAITCPVLLRRSDSSIKETCTGGIGGTIREEIK